MTKTRELTNSLVLKSRELEILVFHFSLYYNVIGGGMARRYWKIPSESQGEKNEFPTSGEAASGEFKFFFAEG